MLTVYATDTITNKRGQNLAAHYWYPPAGVQARCLVYLSHGFSEHLGLYKEVGEFIGERGFLAFGHDHVGHGSSQGKRVYIENVDHYVDDVIHHCMEMQDKHNNLPIFIVGHSMGGMIAVRSVLRHPDFFKGMVLNGPLIVPGPQVGPIDLRSTPIRTFVSKIVLQMLSWIIPNVPIGRPNLSVITRDKTAQAMLERDNLRWTGGCKVMLLLAFVLCLDDNINQLTEIRTPFLTLHGENDRLCNPLGSDLLFRRSPVKDKTIKIFPAACHCLFLEFPEVRREAFLDVVHWIEQRVVPILPQTECQG